MVVPFKLGQALHKAALTSRQPDWPEVSTLLSESRDPHSLYADPDPHSLYAYPDPHSFMQISNGKSSIVEERLYSFFFALFQEKNEASFFRFSSFNQLGTKAFVLLRSCKIFKRFTSLHFVLPKFWNNLVVFCFDLQNFRNKQFVCFRSFYISD